MFVAIAAHIVLDDAKTTEQKRLELIAAAEVAETLFAEIVDQVEQQTGLVVVLAVDVAVARQHVQRRFGGPVLVTVSRERHAHLELCALTEIGRASGRERVCQYV